MLRLDGGRGAERLRLFVVKNPHSEKPGRSQGVDATLAQSLLVGVHEADFVCER